MALCYEAPGLLHPNTNCSEVNVYTGMNKPENKVYFFFFKKTKQYLKLKC